MRSCVAVCANLGLLALQPTLVAGEETSVIPASCPVTRSAPETRFIPSWLPHSPAESVFLYGSDSLYVALQSDGRWRGLRSEAGIRNKLFWYRRNAEWLEEFPYQMKVTVEEIGTEGPMLAVPRVTNAIIGEEVAMLTMLELRRGCWQVTANYKSDVLSFITWAD